MRQFLLATVAATVLSMPAMAEQQSGRAAQEPIGGQTQQMGNGAQQSQQQTAEIVSPNSLNEEEVKAIQQALNEKGFHAGNVDGIWGPETRTALRNFQEKENVQASGQLDRQTLSALGVQVAGSGQLGTVGSGQPGTMGLGQEGTTGSGASDADTTGSDQPGAAQPGSAIESNEKPAGSNGGNQ
jgi:peptidoglycan hydrolase-like protein with peptidoglycan-binding domain